MAPSELLLAAVCMAVTVLIGMTAPVYAAAGPITCANGPAFSTTNSSDHTGKGEACFVTLYIDPVVTVLGGLVAVFVVLSIVIAGIQYSAAADDSSKVAAAKGRIQKAIIALLAYLFLLAFIKYLLPGGVQP
jgi:uncharacterized membrane protein YjgN (DUF898 family)